MTRIPTIFLLVFMCVGSINPAFSDGPEAGRPNQVITSNIEGERARVRLIERALHANAVESITIQRQMGSPSLYVFRFKNRDEPLRVYETALIGNSRIWDVLDREEIPVEERELVANADAAPPNGWSYFWERWFSRSLTVGQMENMFRENRVLGIEREGSESYYIHGDDGVLYYYRSPDELTAQRFNNLVREANVPYIRAAESAAIAFVTTLFVFSLFAAFGMTAYKSYMAFRSRMKAIKSMRLSRYNALKFSDVAGLQEVKSSLGDVVEYLKNPEAFTALGARMPTGVMLEGEPGNGKTMLARAMAGEAGVPFFFVAGSEFMDKWVGTGPQRIRDLFAMARKHKRSIIFIDEFDSIGGKRRGQETNLDREETRIVNQLLTELDGFNRKNRVFLIVATNNADQLDPALTRAGRLDRKVFVPGPDVEARKGILELNTKGLKLAPKLELMDVAKSMPGFSGADVAMACNEAAIIATKEGAPHIEERHFHQALSNIVLGQKRGGKPMNDKERRQVAYHEAGHALASTLLPGSDPVRMATIAPHGRALGAVVQSPDTDRFLISRGEMRVRMAVAMAGRAAEEIISSHPDDITGGAAADIRYATTIARDMVCRLGLNEDVGIMDLTTNVSPLTLARTDRAIQAEVNKAKDAVKTLLTANIEALHGLAKSLLDRESISGDDVRTIVATTHASVPDDFQYIHISRNGE